MSVAALYITLLCEAQLQVIAVVGCGGGGSCREVGHCVAQGMRHCKLVVFLCLLLPHQGLGCHCTVRFCTLCRCRRTMAVNRVVLLVVCRLCM